MVMSKYKRMVLSIQEIRGWGGVGGGGEEWGSFGDLNMP